MAPGEDAGAWRAFLAGAGAGGEILKQDRGSAVVASRFVGSGRDRAVVLKYREGRGWIEGVRAWMGLGREDRQWRGAELVAGASVPTARPLAVGVFGGSPRVRVLALERVPGRTLLDHLATGDLTLGQERALAGEIGRLAGRLSRVGLVNRDAKPSNWVVASAVPERVQLVLIDTVGITASTSSARALGMLASMVIESIGVGCRPRRSVLWRGLRAYLRERFGAVEKRRLREYWQGVAGRIASHGDPTPRVDPRPPGRGV